MPGELAAARAESPAIHTPNVTAESAPEPQPVDIEIPEQAGEKIYSYIHPDGKVASGTREETEKVCTAMQNMSKVQKDLIFSTHDLVQSLATQNRARKEAREKETAINSAEPPVKPRKEHKSEPKETTEPKIDSISIDKSDTAAPEQPVGTSNANHTSQIENELADTSKTDQNAPLKEAAEQQDISPKTETAITEPEPAEPVVADAKTLPASISPVNRDESKVAETVLVQYHSNHSAEYEEANKAITTIAMNKSKTASGITPGPLESKQADSGMATENNSLITPVYDESFSYGALDISKSIRELDAQTESVTVQDEEGVEEIFETEFAGSLATVSVEDSWLPDNSYKSEFEARETKAISGDSEALGMAEIIVSEDAMQTHQELLKIMKDIPETEPAASQTDTELEGRAVASADTNEAPALNIVEIIRAEASLDEEPATMQQVKANAQDAQPLERALTKLSIVLESSPDYSDEPVIKLLAEIAERILAEPARSNEVMTYNLPAAITPEITQLFINLLEELGYEDPSQTLVSFVSQYGINELITTAIYLHQLAESGDQKEYLSGRLPAISSDSPTLPLATLIGRKIFQIIKPEVHVHILALAA